MAGSDHDDDVGDGADVADATTELTETLPESVRVPGYIVQYGVGIPAGVFLGAVVVAPLMVINAFLLPGGIIDTVLLGMWGVLSVAITRKIVLKLRHFQERKLLAASEVADDPTRQLMAAGGRESPVAVRD